MKYRASTLIKCLAMCALALGACDCDDKKEDNNDPCVNNCPTTDMGDMNDMTPDQSGDMPDDMDMSMLTDAQKKILAVPEQKKWTFDGLKDEVQVVYTEMNVPHVYAKNTDDLGYVLGFVVARDRFFVMDLARRLGQGTLSELLGDAALPNDFEARLMGMNAVTQLVLDGMSDEDSAYIDAYVKGINTYIERVIAKEANMPSEFRIIGPLIGKRNAEDLMIPFTRRDIAAMIAVIMYQTNFESGDVGRAAKYAQLPTLFEGAPLQALRRAGAQEDIWNNLATIFTDASAPGFENKLNDRNKALNAPLKGAKHPLAKGEYKPTNLKMLKRAEDRLARMTRLLGKKEIENFGSNTWAVSADKTDDGQALVAGDGHLPLSVPALMYQVGMNTKLFGGGDIHEKGLLITSLPVLAVGTNGEIAWSQVNPVADITDWYREEITLDANGAPASSLFKGEQKPLVKIDEKYTIADIPLLESKGREENWSRYTTFDGRYLFDIEGKTVDADYQPQAGETVLNIGGRYVVPGDEDQDNKITALSFDYTAFDTTGYVRALRGFTKSKDVYEFQEYSKGLIGNMLYSAVADQKGNILFTSYQAVPCRTYLPKTQDKRWAEGADPTMLIDGTTYGGFTIPSQADGKVDEAPGQNDPYKCVVPFDETPQIVNPTEGYVFNANNQPAPITDDGALADDPWYIGGPWSSFRANTIARELQKAADNKTASVDKMAEIQGNTESRTAGVFAQWMIGSIAKAKTLATTDGPKTEDEQRLVNLYEANLAKFNAVESRLIAWSMRNYPTPSGVETFYHTPKAGDADDAVATMIFNAWFPRMIQKIYDDEPMDAAYRYSSIRMKMRALYRFLNARDNSDTNYASYNQETGESAFFDILSTPTIERSDEVMLMALVDAIAFLESDPTAPGEGGFGTEDMDKWIWGLRHQVRFESLLADFLGGTDFQGLIDRFSISTAKLPLAENIGDEDPRKGLKWFPRPGDNYAVDAANPGFSGTRFTHGSGPVMRMVIGLKDGKVTGKNVIPGGQSGLENSPHFADQAKLWLGNETIPLRYHDDEVAEGGVAREVFSPKSE